MQKNEHLAWLLSFAFMTGAGSAGAAEATIGDIGRVQGETLLLNAQVKRAEAAATLTAKSQPPLTAGKAAANAPLSTTLAVDSTMEPPVVRMVYGRGTKLYATFIFANGVMMDATKGDVLIGGYIADVISVDRVELVRGKQRYPIGFAASFPVAAPQPLQQTGNLMGPLNSLPPGLAPTTFSNAPR